MEEVIRHCWATVSGAVLTFIGRIIGQFELCLHILCACLQHVERDEWLGLFRAAKVCNHLDHLPFVDVQHKLLVFILEYTSNAHALGGEGNLQVYRVLVSYDFRNIFLYTFTYRLCCLKTIRHQPQTLAGKFGGKGFAFRGIGLIRNIATHKVCKVIKR